MARIVSAEELDLIERIISEYPEGIGISALEKALAGHLPDINRRTLQRRLKKLRDDHRIITEGESIALVYQLVTIGIIPESAVVKVESDAAQFEAYIPLIRNNLCPLCFVDVPEQAYIDGTLGIMNSTKSISCEMSLSGLMNAHASDILQSAKPWSSRIRYGSNIGNS